MRYCLSIANCATTFSTEEFVELRCDLMGIAADEVVGLIGMAERAIVTCHTPNAESIYIAAIEAGCWAVDIDILQPRELIDKVLESAKANGTKVIFSRHYPTTPPFDTLVADTKEALEVGADIVKIITTAHTTEEATVPLGLYEHFAPERLVAFAMGEVGRFSRRLSLLLGAPYTYVCPYEEGATASGQPTREWLERSFECPHALESYTLPLSVTPPCSKSEAQRAILMATMAEGTTILRSYTPCGDAESAIALAKALGAEVCSNGSTLTIKGVGLEGVRKALSHTTKLTVGESALLARLLMPIVSMFAEGEVTITGTGTLLGRSMEGDLRTLERYGAKIRHCDNRLPITILRRAFAGGEIEIDGSQSSQTISGWMVALALTAEEHHITIRGAVSRPYIELTANILSKFGAEVEVVSSGEDMEVTIRPSRLSSREITLSTDWSSAGYLIAAFAIAQSGYATREAYLLRATTATLQPDEQIVDILRSMGAQIEPTTEGLRLLPSTPLRAFEFDATDAPDLIPTLAVLALYSEGTSRIGGIHRLASKESNRTEALYENFVAMGASVKIEGTEMVIQGGAKLHPAPLRTHNDHRIAMALTVAGMFMAKRPQMDNIACVGKSFPEFYEILSNKTI